MRKIRKILPDLWHFAIKPSGVKCRICNLRVVGSNPAPNTFFLTFFFFFVFFSNLRWFWVKSSPLHPHSTPFFIILIFLNIVQYLYKFLVYIPIPHITPYPQPCYQQNPSPRPTSHSRPDPDPLPDFFHFHNNFISSFFVHFYNKFNSWFTSTLTPNRTPFLHLLHHTPTPNLATNHPPPPVGPPISP